MARLIVKSPYVKNQGGRVAGYAHYIGTRERVELIPDDRPPTRKQEQLITKLVRDFPGTKELYEYEDYQERPTKANASALISVALESNWESVCQTEGYASYIATRPRAERLGDHGLFGDEDNVSLEKVVEELEQYTGNVWTHVISLHREDAARLGYDNAKSWRNLLRTHRNDVAAAMHIPPKDFRWCAAFHNEGTHPHIHMMAWSVKPGQAYLSRDGIRKIKSELMTDIFKQELLHTYEQKSASRDELVREARQAMLDLTAEMRRGICDHPEAEALLLTLAGQLSSAKGKKTYGYLPKSTKATVDEVMDLLERVPAVAECYQKWWELQCQVEDYYAERERTRPPLSQQKEFRAIKNAVIQEAENIRAGVFTFEDAGVDGQDEPEQDYGVSTAFWNLKIVIQDESLSLDEQDAAVGQLEKLAECGDVDAQYFMGALYRDGPLVVPDNEKAREWFEKAADQGMAAAQYALGKLLLSDNLAVRDTEPGIRWLQTAARNRSHHAAYRLGKEYIQGQAVKRDIVKAAEYLKQAAEAGNQYAQYALGKLLVTNSDAMDANDEPEPLSTDPDMSWSAEMYRRAKTELYSESTTPEQKQTAALALEELWKLGFTLAAHQLGKCYRDGLGLAQDLEKVEQWFRRSAEAGHDYSQYALGRLLQEQGCMDEAVGWYEKAAELGNQYAEFQLGKLYLTGQSEEQNRELALYWFTQSANQGNEYAQYFLDRQGQITSPSVMLAVTNLLYHLSRIFREQAPQDSTAGGIRIDRKQMARIREKKIAMGHKADDHDDPVQEHGWGMSMV